MTNLPIISIILALPVLGAIIIAAVPRQKEFWLKWLAFSISLITFIVSLFLYFAFQKDSPIFQFQQFLPWIPALGVNYHVGIDGISLWLVILTTFLSVVAIASSWTAIKEQPKEFLVLMLLLETAAIGVFVSMDIILFFVFWEASLIPMALLIGRWGGERRIYAAVKFFIYTMAGSALMLVGIISLYLLAGSNADYAAVLSLKLPPDMQKWLFAAFALAFAVKVPLFPLHTWLPAAHVEAPTAGSIILAGVLLKMGAYGFLRYAIPLFPEAVPVFTPLFSVLALIGIVYGALVALAQEDLKSLVAYSSIAHMGYIVLGIFAANTQAVSGAVLQMVNHGLSTGALFFLVGVIYERRHTRLLKDYGGIWARVPIFGSFFILTALSSVGLPGLNGFVGEFNILLGTFRVNVVYAAIATFGIVLAAWYLLTAIRRLLFGVFNEANSALSDMNAREIAIITPIAVLYFVIGFFPNIFLRVITPSMPHVNNVASIIPHVASLLGR